MSIGKTRRALEPLEASSTTTSRFAAVRDVADFVGERVVAQHHGPAARRRGGAGSSGRWRGRERGRGAAGAAGSAGAGGRTGAGGARCPVVKIAPDLDDDGVVALARTARELGLARRGHEHHALARRPKTPAAESRPGAGGGGPALAACRAVRLVRGELASTRASSASAASTVDDVLALASASADGAALHRAVYGGPARGALGSCGARGGRRVGGGEGGAGRRGRLVAPLAKAGVRSPVVTTDAPPESERLPTEPEPAPGAGRSPWVELLHRMVWPLAFVVVAVLVVGVVRERAPKDGPGVRVEHPTPTLVAELRTLARLETLTLRLEKIVDLRDHQTKLFGLVDTEDGLLFVASGEVVLGVARRAREDVLRRRRERGEGRAAGRCSTR